MFSVLGGIFLGWSLGSNDASNVIGPAVTSRMLRFSTAASMAAIFVLAGAMLQGRSGIHTLTSLTGITLHQAVLASVSAAITVTIMTIVRLPVSTSQAVVGAILGIGLVNRHVDVTNLGKVVLCWIGTPLGGAVMAVVVYWILAAVNNRLRLNLLEEDALIRVGLVAAGAYGAFALGANNVANVTAVFVGAGHLSILTATLVGGLSIGLGILTFSRGVMSTVGSRLVHLDSFSALVVLLAEAVTVHFYTFVGVPVSTSQAVIGAVMGIGLVKGIRTINAPALLSILSGWLLTPLIAAALVLGMQKM
jgi:PiT family inorganic phosphate transporter